MSASNSRAHHVHARKARVGYSDATKPRILAYLASVRPMRGCARVAESEEYIRGRQLIERMAREANASDWPALRLTASECADVLTFMRISESALRGDWWADPKDAPSHVCGFYMVVGTLEDSLRDPAVQLAGRVP